MSTIQILGFAFLIAAASGCQRDSAASITQSGVTPTEILAAVERGDINAIDKLIAQGANLDARVPGDGTALIVASRQGKLAIVDRLLSAGAGVNVASAGDGNPLINASKAGHADVVKRLMGAGADPNAVVPGDETPLINAAREAHLEIVEYLVEQGADVNLGATANLDQWRTPLNQASNESIKSYLVSHGAKN